MSKDDFLRNADVSRETFERMEHYANLLTKWNPAINLVAPSTLPELWARHFLDSAQIESMAPNPCKIWCDVGTGGGFPGVVTAIMALETDPDRETVCIESDQRKATFLRTVARETGANLRVLSQRIESAPPQNAEVFSARALARLNVLLEFAERHLASGGTCLFLKGENYQREVKEALENWRFELDTYPSKTNSDAVILKIGELTRA